MQHVQNLLLMQGIYHPGSTVVKVTANGSAGEDEVSREAK
jgi:hypothetical protein